MLPSRSDLRAFIFLVVCQARVRGILVRLSKLFRLRRATLLAKLLLGICILLLQEFNLTMLVFNLLLKICDMSLLITAMLRVVRSSYEKFKGD